MSDLAPSAPQPQTVTVLNPYGDLGVIQKADLPQALSSGFKVAPNSMIQAYNDHLQYGEGLGNMAKAFGAGAARGATFGLSDEALTHSGLVDPHTLEALKEQNPASSFLGEAAGIGGSLIAAPELSPVGAVAGVGEAAGEAAAPIAQGLTESASPIVQDIAAKVAPMAVGSAVEGAAYGAGQSVSEDALGDPNLNAEKVMANIGLGGLFGGALGATIGGAEVAMPKAFSAAKDSLAKVYDSVAGPDETGVGLFGRAYAKASSFVSGKPEQNILDLIRNRDELLKTPDEKLKMAQNLADSLGQHYDDLQEAMRSTSSEIRPKETKELLDNEDFPVDPGQASELYQNVMDALDQTTAQMRSEQDVYPQGYARKLEMIADRVDNRVNPEIGTKRASSPTANDYFQALDDLKNSIDKEIKYGKIPGPGDQDAQNLIKSLRFKVKNALENEDVFGPAASIQATYNDATNDLLTKQKLFQKTFMRKIQSRTGGIEWKIDASKVKSFLSQINSLTGTQKADILQEYLSSSQNMLDHIQDAYESHPTDSFNPQAIRSHLDEQKTVVAKALKQAKLNHELGVVGSGMHNSYMGDEFAGLELLEGHPGSAAALEGLKSLFTPGQTIERIARLERMANKTTDLIQKAAKDALKPVGEGFANASEAMTGYLGSKLSPVPNTLGAHMAQSHHEKTIEALNNLTNDPEQLIDKMSKATDPLFRAAPKTSQGLTQTASRAIQFLQSQSPSISPSAPLSPRPKLSNYQKAQFQKMVNVVERPISVLKMLKEGTLTPDVMNAVQTVYPNLVTEMRSELMDQISKRPAEIPYRAKLMLSLFFGEDLTESTTSTAISLNQLTFQQNSKQAQTKPMPQAQKLTQSEQALTPMQASAQRGRA